MTIEIRNKNAVPAGEFWKAKHWTSGVLLKALSWQSLLRVFREHSLANNYSIGPEFEQQIERAVCQEMPHECEEVVAGQRIVPCAMTHGTILRGTMVIAALLASGRQLVEPEEAERRAQICSKCPMNRDYSKPCGGVCQELQDIVVGIVGGSKLVTGSELKACACCCCINEAQVWVPLNILKHGVTTVMKQQFAEMAVTHSCWKQVGDQ